MTVGVIGTYAYAYGTETNNREIIFERFSDGHIEAKVCQLPGKKNPIAIIFNDRITVKRTIFEEQANQEALKKEGKPRFNGPAEKKFSELDPKEQEQVIKDLTSTEKQWRIQIQTDFGPDPSIENVTKITFFKAKAGIKASS